MREPLTEDDVLDYVDGFDGASPQVQIPAADQLLAWAESPHPDDGITVGQLLTLAGERYQLGGDAETTERIWRRAAAERPTDGPDPRCLLTEHLLGQGRAEEASELDNEVRKSRPDDPFTYLWMGEAWEEHGDARRALGWFNRGLAYVDRHGGFDERDVEMLCLDRWRVRQAQGMEPDEYDEVAIAIRDAHQVE